MIDDAYDICQPEGLQLFGYYGDGSRSEPVRLPHMGSSDSLVSADMAGELWFHFENVDILFYCLVDQQRLSFVLIDPTTFHSITFVWANVAQTTRNHRKHPPKQE